MDKIIEHPIVGRVVLRKRANGKTIRLSVSSRRGILISMPLFVTYNQAIKFLDSKVQWILQAQLRQQEHLIQQQQDGKLVSAPEDYKEFVALVRKARAELVPKLAKLAEQYGFGKRNASGFSPEYRRVALRNNTSNWGSCSGKNNINLNIKLVLLPEHLQDYVIIHELCHLRHHDHGEEFHRLLDSLLGGKEKALRRELNQWRLQ